MTSAGRASARRFPFRRTGCWPRAFRAQIFFSTKNTSRSGAAGSMNSIRNLQGKRSFCSRRLTAAPRWKKPLMIFQNLTLTVRTGRWETNTPFSLNGTLRCITTSGSASKRLMTLKNIRGSLTICPRCGKSTICCLLPIS